ncbi:hypothetical protein [Pseudozobellia sp. WGM2]|uniref:hypothetical protein n=1 Tax=Pseudozobellia sp. WGM2 TaxID=2787625 RepID=UPI001AE0A6CE|nr:hypothetical protein [Pseudozobellia sp. WGM2]
MTVYENTTTKAQFTNDKNVQLKRLDRNQRDIDQFSRKLSSYLCEPKTYHQFVRFNELKENVSELAHSNENIITELRSDENASARCSGMLQKHLDRFQNFASEVVEYLRDVKVTETTIA